MSLSPNSKIMTPLPETIPEISESTHARIAIKRDGVLRIMQDGEVSEKHDRWIVTSKKTELLPAIVVYLNELRDKIAKVFGLINSEGEIIKPKESDIETQNEMRLNLIQHLADVGLTMGVIKAMEGGTLEEALIHAESGFLHDIGKVALEKDTYDIILDEKHKLKKDDPKDVGYYQSQKEHPVLGVELFNQLIEQGWITVKDHQSTEDVIRLHHVREDRDPERSYPEFDGELSDIVILSSVVDARSAMRMRPYEGKTREETLEELVKCIGSQFGRNAVQRLIQSEVSIEGAPQFVD